MYKNLRVATRAIAPIRTQISRNVASLSTRSITKTATFSSIRTYSSANKQLKQILKQESETVKDIPNELNNVYKDYIINNNLEVITKEGQSNVELRKPLENGEMLQIFFDIDEVTDMPIDEFQPEEGEEEEIDFDESINNMDSLLCSVKVLISKPNNEGLFLNLFLQSSESSFMIDFINYKSNVEQFVTENINKGEFLHKFNYQGPRFSELDESIQTGFETYLEAKGINDELADFIISFSEMKEENEYRTWLNELTNFF